MSLTVLRTALDWLQVSFAGTLSDEFASTLPGLKERAQERNTPQPIEVGLAEFMVLEKARGHFAFVLKHPEFELMIAPNAPSGSAAASIRLSAFGLANTEPAALWALARTCLDELGCYSPLAVSRVDVAADFQGWEPTPADMASVVCPASYRATHGTERQAQTFQFGKGAVVLRLYNKTAEIAVSKKPWMQEVWELTGRYDPSLPVWRVEVQLRREILRELGVRSAEQVLEDPGALLDYGLGWAQLRVPSADYTKARWPEDPRWTALRGGVYAGVPLGRHPRVSELMSLDRAISQYIGAIATAAAYYGTDDYMQTNVRVAYAAEALMMRNETGFAELVETKRRRMIGGL